MAGDSINAARKALHTVMQEMTEQDWISYSRFGSNVHHELSGLQPCNTTTIKQIATLIDATEADLGGTEMNAALISTFELGVSQGFKSICAKSENKNCSKDLLLITDGDIWHVEAVIQVAQQSGHRIFAIGVGSAPAESLLREIAEKSGGACELVTPNQDVAVVIVRMFRRMRATRCIEVKVDWGQHPLWQSTLPSTIYGGDTLHLCARLSSMPEYAPKLTWLSNTISMHASAAHLQSQSPDLLPRIVASKQIAQLTSLEEQENQEQALELALKYQLVTEQTNLILVHVRDEDKKAEGLPELSKVHQMLAAGWGGAGSESKSAAASYCIPAFFPKNTNRRGVVFLDKHNWTVLYSRSKASAYNVLHTFEDSAEKVFALYRFVRNLDALKDQPNELIQMLSSLTKNLGTRRKAWAVVIVMLAERKLGRYTLSRRAERLLCRVLKGENDVVLQELILTWSVSIDSLMNPQLRSLSEDDMPVPAFLRHKADKH
jgi:hypothetical protein